MFWLCILEWWQQRIPSYIQWIPCNINVQAYLFYSKQHVIIKTDNSALDTLHYNTWKLKVDTYYLQLITKSHLLHLCLSVWAILRNLDQYTELNQTLPLSTEMSFCTWNKNTNIIINAWPNGHTLSASGLLSLFEICLMDTFYLPLAYSHSLKFASIIWSLTWKQSL
jgi:hypothetical protein